jgi:ABC-type antimicrobial peptide transport system permease subunit
VAANLNPLVRGSWNGAVVAGGLGALALVMASVGIVGLFSYWVHQRTHEIGIHMALGATPSRVLRLLLASSGKSLLMGAVGGIVASFAATNLIRSYLFGISRADPLAYSAMILLLLVAGSAATWLPARRATRIDPVVALRCD